jgi:hypothetical protein
MLHPSQFQVHQAWISFKLNDAPIRTDRDGDLNLFALMDAASCYIMSTRMLSTSSAEPELSCLFLRIEDGSRGRMNQASTRTPPDTVMRLNRSVFRAKPLSDSLPGPKASSST